MTTARTTPWLLICIALAVAACGKSAPPQPAATAAVAPESAARPAPAVDVVAHPDPLAALQSTDSTLATNKRAVFDMWRSIVDAGHTEVADELLEEGYTQHSPILRTGRKAFKEIFSVVPRRDIPELVEPPLVASVAERNLVVMALLERMKGRDGAKPYATAHFNLFRVENGRLAEHWHSVQNAPGPDVPLPEDGGPQPVKGVSGEAQRVLLEAADPRLAANKRLVFDLWREAIDAGHEEVADRYLDASFVEHNPNGASGLAGFKAYFSTRPDSAVEPAIRAPVVAIVAEGDLVVLVTMAEHPHPSRPGRTYTTTWFDMFRVVDGKIVEHWDPAARPGESAWPPA
jgi:predicted SnoaL-like aldol condensation-catalyzing enzyme